ncbi:hypothetical protein Syun_010831 [Stephania yunnanensis]|uniref:GTP-eEF1A C-terminal domain-containing protein n=1 Tax=Stephania yunnanensis TaxID=152371 RepID=A0AAP0PHX1_9MAGN
MVGPSVSIKCKREGAIHVEWLEMALNAIEIKIAFEWLDLLLLCSESTIIAISVDFYASFIILMEEFFRHFVLVSALCWNWCLGILDSKDSLEGFGFWVLGLGFVVQGSEKPVGVVSEFDAQLQIIAIFTAGYKAIAYSFSLLRSVNNLICIEKFSKFPQLGRFTLRTEGKIVAVGKVTGLLPFGTTGA